MIAEIGFITLVLALLTSVYTTVAVAYGNRTNNYKWVESARNATIVTLPLVTIACGLIVVALVQDDFSLDYVWQVSSREMPTYLKVTALWGGQAGSLMLWNWLLAIFTAASMIRKWGDQKELMPYVLIVGSFSQIFFLSLSVFVENPFALSEFIPPDGNGLNPLLRHPGMIIHPPVLYLGYVGFLVPYGFAMAALMSGKLDDAWIRTTRRWTLIAWLFLSLGMILGGRWAYDVLGWGGYWAWDPVENASFMPWLAGTAFLHSVMIQEKRDMFKMWNMVLIVLTYVLVIYGTFIVRSGVISSVHSFAQSAIGPLFFGFLAFMVIFSAGWLFVRWDSLKSKNRLDSFYSREAAFLYNNFLFLAILAIVALFTNYPILSELVTGEKGFVGPPVYEQALWPLFLALVLLMGVAPLTMWYRSSPARIGMSLRWPAVAATIGVGILFAFGMRQWLGLLGIWVVIFSAILTILEFWKGTRARMKKGEPIWTAFGRLMARNRRRYGGYWIHIGVLVMAVGIVGVEIYQEETQVRLEIGDTVELANYEMQFVAMDQYPGPDDLIITEATVDVYDNGRYVGQLNPRSELYTRTGQPMTIPGSRSTLTEDFYVITVNWEEMSAQAATFRVYNNPMINWVWAGGFIFIFGTMVAVWPSSAAQRSTVRKPRMAVATD